MLIVRLGAFEVVMLALCAIGLVLELPVPTALAVEHGEPAKAIEPAQTAKAPAQIVGFRSARFDSDEAQLQQAIKQDFNLTAKDITRSKNEAEGTAILQIAVDNLLPVGGKVSITYILGFTSKKLFQINVVWGGATGKPATPQSLVTAANMISQHLLTRSYRPESTVVNGQTADGSIIVFRGADQQGRMALLMLTGEPEGASKEGPSPMKPTTLMLSYIKDSEHPDVFRTKPGDF